MEALIRKNSKNVDFCLWDKYSVLQTCFCQHVRMSCFSELPDVVLPKIAQKSQNTSKIDNISRFLWNPHLYLVAPKSTTSGFLAFLTNFWPKIARKCQKPEVVNFNTTTRHGFSQKSPNLDYFSVIFCVFEQFLANHIS